MRRNTPVDISKARRKHREKQGWSTEEIKKKALKELKEYRELSKNEPPEFASGDMSKILDDEDGDQDESERNP